MAWRTVDSSHAGQSSPGRHGDRQGAAPWVGASSVVGRCRASSRALLGVSGVPGVLDMGSGDAQWVAIAQL